MKFVITIEYETEASWDEPPKSVHSDIGDLLECTLPYMVDNVNIKFDVAED